MLAGTPCLSQLEQNCSIWVAYNNVHICTLEYYIMDISLSEFDGFPSQKNVATVMLKQGLSVNDGKVYCGDIEISDSSLGRAAKVDRRVVRATVEKIESSPNLLPIFSKLKCMALLSDVAPDIGCSVIEIIPEDASEPGILADITQVIFIAGISIRQAVVDDRGNTNEARLIAVLDGQLPPVYIPRLRSCRGVKSVILR